jgi:NAD(P)-dependent dehydrogenase (short-subunit alcohol dehydrogenase family)
LNFGTPGTARVGPADGLVGLRASASTESELQSIFNINLFSLVALTHELLPLLRKSKAGRIINLASILGSLTLQSMEQSPIAPMRKFAYNASKAAVNVFTIHLAAELKECVGPRSLILTVSLLWFKLPDCS